METNNKVKEISIDNLNQAEKKIAAGKLKRLGLALAILAALGGGAYAVFRLVSGDVTASRFAVNKMNCPACVITIKEVITKVPGVVEADVSLSGQEALVKYREKQTTPDEIRNAVQHAGYPTKHDGLYDPKGQASDGQVQAFVNGKPVFKKDLAVPLTGVNFKATSDISGAFYTVVGSRLLLDAADKVVIAVQPQEIEAESAEAMKAAGLGEEEYAKRIGEIYGSKEKYYQTIGRRLAVQRLIEDSVLAGIKDPEERARKTTEWIGSIFKNADVKIVDPELKGQIRSSAGQEEWKTFWPRMIASQTELRSILIR